MYIPKHFLVEDKAQIIAFMKEYSFATIVSLQEETLVATHLPFVVEERDDRLFLVSHFARANSQWKELQKQKVLVIFSEPHAYISPKYYEGTLNVPTWNYVAVHAYGQPVIITDEQMVMDAIEKTVKYYETDYLQQWMQLPAEYKHKMLKGIVVFEIVVDDLQAKYKLSQNRTTKEKELIGSSLKVSESTVENKLGQIMENINTKN